MATPGVPIDFSKKYKMVNGCKTIEFETTNNEVYSIKAYFFNNKQRMESYIYTADGFYWGSKRSDDRDLILDEDQLPETKKRKIVQFNTLETNLGYWGFAVTDDGLIFTCDLGRDLVDIVWQKLAEIPQD